MVEKAGRHGPFMIFPHRGSQGFHVIFRLHGEDQEGRAGGQAHPRKSDREHRAHLFKFERDSTRIMSAAIGKDAKIRAANFGEGFFAGERRDCKQQSQNGDQCDEFETFVKQRCHAARHCVANNLALY